jgi:uracil-DNA glycosylase
MKFVPSWPVHGSYFPLEESGLTLNDIAYCNIVRCRTEKNAAPSSRMSYECAGHHFARWLDLLKPRAVVFIGKWAHDKGSHLVNERQIPGDFMNRERSLSADRRAENRQRVVAFIRSVMSGQCGHSQL